MPEVTAVTAAVCAIMLVAMGADAARQRARHRVPLQGFPDNKHVTRAVRIHGNFAEYVPMALVLMLLLELRGTSSTLLWAAGAALIVGRVAHWVALKTSSGNTPWRIAGMSLTWTVLVGCALGLLGSVFLS